MIAIAVVAVLMGVLRLARDMRVGVGVILFLALLVGGFLEFVVFCAYFWPGKRPHEQYLRRIKYRARISRAEPKRGGRESVG
jgi:hypothetical protein